MRRSEKDPVADSESVVQIWISSSSDSMQEKPMNT